MHAQKREAAMVNASHEEDKPDPLAAVETGEKGALDQLLERERAERLREAVAQLPDQMRRCVTVRIMEDVPYDVIAARLGISVNTVKVHLHNARKALARKLRPYFGELDL